MKTTSDILQAVKLISSGQSKNAVSRKTGIDKKTLNVYLSRYLSEGDQAFARRYYSLQTKKAIVLRHLDDNVSISLLSADVGIPCITIRRWIKAYLSLGDEGLCDHRRKKYKPQYLTHSAVNEALFTLQTCKNRYLRQIPSVLSEIGAFKNTGFVSFLIIICDFCKLILFDPSRSIVALSDDELKAIYTAARLCLRYDGSNHDVLSSAEAIIETKEVQLFLSIFIAELANDLIHTNP